MKQHNERSRNTKRKLKKVKCEKYVNTKRRDLNTLTNEEKQSNEKDLQTQHENTHKKVNAKM